jgi:glyoxylase-like metal-dependent hydrolase (beta-lactamase superfamily II)
VTSPAPGATGAADLPDYAPIPRSALGPALNEQGYYVGGGAEPVLRHRRRLPAWHGPNHSPDNIYIHFPGHDTLMFIDVVNAGWVPIYNLNLSEDVPGYMAAPAIALNYPWRHFICGHLGRLATREDVAVHQAYIADIEASAKEALAAVDPVPYYMAAGENFWAGVKAHLDAVTERAAAPITAKYTGVLAAADIDVFTWTTTFAIMQSLRLDRGPSGPVHP